MNAVRLWLPWFAVLAVGCGASALDAHSQAVAGSYHALEAARVVIESKHEHDVNAVADRAERHEYDTRYEAMADIEAAHRNAQVRYGPLIAIHEAMRAAHHLYATAVLEALAADEVSWATGLVAARALVESWSRLLRAAQSVEIEIPAPPRVLLDVLGGEG